MLFYLELYFLIQWEDRDKEDGHDLLDVLPAKAIVVDSDANLELLGEGDNYCHYCQALFNKKMYPATIIVGSGKLWMHPPSPLSLSRSLPPPLTVN